MPQTTSKTEKQELLKMSLELNRHLFEENGDALAVAVADYIRHRKIKVSGRALDFLVDAIQAVR